MTIAELYRAAEAGGVRTAGLIAAVPLCFGAVAWMARRSGNARVSQRMCNMGIAVALGALAMEVFALLVVARKRNVDVIGEVNLALLLAPALMVALAFAVEHLLHPDQQICVRRQLRAGLLAVIVLAVLFFILGELRFYMLIWTSMTGFLLFLAVIIAILYFVVRKFL